jgi:hypothetical protein
MWRKLGVVLLCGVAVLLFRTVATAAPHSMTDAELDEVAASGGVSFSLDAGDSPSFTFSFDQGGSTGTGSVTTSPNIWTPSTLTMQGAVDLSHALINVQNMIFNLNICVQCSGTILQSAIGIPITIKTTP